MATIIGKCSLPKNCFSIYEIAKFENITEQKIKSLMNTALKNATLSSPNKTITGIKEFYNNIGCNDNYINAFNTHFSLQPFAKAIRMETEKTLTRGKLNECIYATFYVNKQVYLNWKKKGIRYEHRQLNISSFNANAKANKTTLTFPTTYVITHFKDVVKNKLNMNLNEVVITAIDFFMKQHSDIFGEYKGEIDESAIVDNKSSFVFGYVDKELNNKIWQFIQRYNQVNTPPIKYGEFLESALAEKLEKIPIQYTNPQLFKEYQELLKENEKLENELKESE